MTDEISKLPNKNEYHFIYTRFSPLVIITVISSYIALVIISLIVINQLNNELINLFLGGMLAFFLFLLIIIILLSGNGKIVVTIDDDSHTITSRKIFRPFHFSWLQYESERQGRLIDIKQFESSIFQRPNALYFLLSLLLLMAAMIIALAQIATADDTLGIYIVILLIGSLLAMIIGLFFGRKKVYQIKIKFGDFFPFIHPFEFMYDTFFSTGMWIIRCSKGDYKELQGKLTKIISKYPSN